MINFYENKKDKIIIVNGGPRATRPHFHKHIEIIAYKSGKSLCIVDGKRELIEGGGILVVFPNQVHEIIDIEPSENYMAIFDPDICPEYRDIFTSKIPEFNIIKSSGTVTQLFESLYSEYNDPENLEFAKHIYKGYIMAISGLLLKNLTLNDYSSAELDAVHNVILYCMENYKRKILLDDIASALHLSKYYISHIFSKNISMSMTDYINGLRISDAENLLKQGKYDITQIAYECGFENIRSFNRAFAKLNGTSPTAWLKKSGS